MDDDDGNGNDVTATIGAVDDIGVDDDDGFDMEEVDDDDRNVDVDANVDVNAGKVDKEAAVGDNFLTNERLTNVAVGIILIMVVVY